MKKLKGMDEMDRNIQLRSEEIAYRVTVISLSIWTLYKAYQTLKCGVKYSPLPVIILAIAVCTQTFAKIAIKQKMVAGDEDYKEPNKFLEIIPLIIVLTAIVLYIGTRFISK